jgi:hypothetical protein
LSTPFGVWPIIGHFESAFTNYLPSLLAASQSLSPLSVTIIYNLFPAFATIFIIVSDFKFKMEYFTLSLRGMLEYMENI